MALLGDILKYDKVDFQNLEAKLWNGLRAESGMEQIHQTDFFFTYFYQLSGNTWFLRFK